MTVITVGSFHVLIKIVTLTRVLQVKVSIFHKTSIFILSVQTCDSSLGDVYAGPLFSQNIQYNLLFFQKKCLPQICMDFHRFSFIFIGFQPIFMDFFRFSLISMNFSWISQCRLVYWGGLTPPSSTGPLFRLAGVNPRSTRWFTGADGLGALTPPTRQQQSGGG